MLIKRFSRVIISFAVGFIATWAIIITIAQSNLQIYGPWYTFFTSLAIGCAVGVWLDKFMGTELLPK